MVDGKQLGKRLVPELVASGALAVVLTGSYARGDATEASDLDLMIIGSGPDYRLSVREGVLLAESWASEAEHRRRLGAPRAVGASVPGWRQAVVLHDPQGVAERLKQEALGWSWEQIGDGCDSWVAEQVVGFAEEVQKLAAALDGKQALMAAVQRDLLALRLAPILAVHHRLLYGSENVLWEQVSDQMGDEWRRLQSAAFGMGGERFDASCLAALHLYRLAALSTESLLSESQAAVVEHALAMARRSTFSGGIIRVRSATIADVPSLSDLARRTWSDAFGDSIDPESEAAELEQGRSESYFASVLPEKTILVAEDGFGLLGYAQFGDVSIPDLETEPEDRCLNRLYVETAFQGLGLGRTLLEASLCHPRLAQAPRIFLQVWEQNERAVQLYRSVGFKKVGTTAFAIGTDVVEDEVMLLEQTDLQLSNTET